MRLKTSTTGSWPPVYDKENNLLVNESIERAIKDQIDLGIDILVDGQARDDIVSLFARKLPGYKGKALPYQVVSRIAPADEPITTQDYLYAKKFVEGKPLKAHITGPMTLARASNVDAESPYSSRNDPKLIQDLAEAIGREAYHLVKSGAETVQIDEPALADGVDLDLAFAVMKKIVEIGEIPFPALHICKNVTRILDDVLRKSPVKMVSIEGEWLRHPKLSHVDSKYLSQCGNKQIGLGCIETQSLFVEKIPAVQNFLDLMVSKLGEDHIWAAMTNCGLRLIPEKSYGIAINKLKVMVKAAESL
jgi:5-methyltetrahydropteroyltriglutamate--homocysteine methyltransferase